MGKLLWKNDDSSGNRTHDPSTCLTARHVMAANSYGFIAQLVEHCTGIAEVTGSNPAEA